MHTQGKWEADKAGQITSGECKICDCYMVRTYGVTDGQMQANARLIAAAPALLKLAGNYLSDVECRIQSIKHDRDNNECAQHDPDVYDGYSQQIVHWAATAHHVEQVIKQAESGQ